MCLSWLCVFLLGFLLPAIIARHSYFFILSVPLWQAGMERVVVYPGKLPIVYDRNSVWEGEPPEQGSEDAEKHWWGLCASTGN